MGKQNENGNVSENHGFLANIAIEQTSNQNSNSISTLISKQGNAGKF
jgi:hypothetical protein